ncbi:MAG: hypothetical protein IPL61_09105 [Myxococcales bacterium]|nr:hypothetical protein [Myxococcales bacterium]
MDPSDPPAEPGAPQAAAPASAARSARNAIVSLLEEVPAKSFLKFLKISAKRAFRLRIDPAEVLPAERYALAHASPPITEPNLQAFLAWRRSVLFLVACALVPLTVIGLYNGLSGTLPSPIRFVKVAPAVAEALFLVICWTQLKRWAHWRTQRRWLFWGWLLFMLTPFIVFVYPLRSILDDLPHTKAGMVEKARSLQAMGFGSLAEVRRMKDQVLMPFVFSMIAMLQLAPKAISVMPGLIRASMVVKLLFPGSSAPGWLIAMAAPMYALLAYVILIIPYQFTGDTRFITGILLVVVGQGVLARSGFRLARPLSEEEAVKYVKQVRLIYMITMFLSAVLIVAALSGLVKMIHLRISDVVLTVLKFESNVLMLTLIGADLVVTNLDRARSYTAGVDHVEEAAELKIAAFVGLDAPPEPPPPQ